MAPAPASWLSTRALTEQAASNEDLVSLWLHGRPAHTQRAYRRDAGRFRALVDRSLREVTVGDVQAFVDTLQELAPACQAREIAAVKSLLAFGHQLGYLPFDVGRVIKLPHVRDTLAQRILPEADVHRILALETDRRNSAMLRLFYAAGVRVDELVSLTWGDLQPRNDTGQLTVYGKGGKTRVVLLPLSVWQDLAGLPVDHDPCRPVFRSQRGGHLATSQAWRIVRAAARRAGLSAPVSPPWLRHAHASHAMDRGAPLHLVAATLGHTSVATTGRYLAV
jgi:integrase/recombinase XerD